MLFAMSRRAFDRRARVTGWMAFTLLLGAACAGPPVVPPVEQDAGPRPEVPDGGHVADGGPAPCTEPLTDVQARFPWNGYRTGGAVVPLDAPIVDHPLRPRFAWGRVCAATHYELEVDDSCDPRAYEGCAMPSPEARLVTSASDVNLEEPLPVELTPPVGRRYFWRVRACDEAECTAWSPVRYLDVGRAPADYDGDGYPDFAVGMRWGPYLGRLDVWRGGPGGLDVSRVLTLRHEGLDLRAYDLVPAGDLNGDGFDELFVVAERIEEDLSSSSLGGELWWGGPEGPSSPTPVPYPGVSRFGGVTNWRPSHHWMQRLGDLDADGYDDAYIGATDMLLYGSPDGWVSVGPLVIESPTDYPPLTSIDLDADGVLDLVWPQRVRLGAESAYEARWRYGRAGERERGTVHRTPSYLGMMLNGPGWARVDDADRDGFAELVVVGLNFLYRASAGPTLDLALDEEDVWAEGRVLSYLPPRTFAADVDGDGYGDLIVDSVTLDGNPEGEARIATRAEVRVPDREDRLTTPNPSAVHDYDGDGYADQAWIVDLWEDDPGSIEDGSDLRLFVFEGGRHGLPWQQTREVEGFAERDGDPPSSRVVVANGTALPP